MAPLCSFEVFQPHRLVLSLQEAPLAMVLGCHGLLLSVQVPFFCLVLGFPSRKSIRSLA